MIKDKRQWRPDATKNDWHEVFGPKSTIDFLEVENLCVRAQFDRRGKRFTMHITGYFEDMIKELRELKKRT